MIRKAVLAAMIGVGLIAWAGQTWAASKFDTYVAQLKDPDAHVRAAAADKLGCG
ncbi:MAG: hypothetical protein AB1646_03015 [Thermodesulfobacteriota bacterium]